MFVKVGKPVVDVASAKVFGYLIITTPDAPFVEPIPPAPAGSVFFLI
jgi:hypothetical protein